MKIVEMTYEVTETCQNGKERTMRKKVYANKMYQFEEGKQLLEQHHYYHIIFIKAVWKDVYFL